MTSSTTRCATNSAVLATTETAPSTMPSTIFVSPAESAGVTGTVPSRTLLELPCQVFDGRAVARLLEQGDLILVRALAVETRAERLVDDGRRGDHRPASRLHVDDGEPKPNAH